MRCFVGLMAGLAGCALGTWSGWAQQEPAEAGTETIVVTANKYPLSLEDLPSAITIIDREQIDASPATTVAELLASTAGVHFYELNGAGTSPVTDLRGFNSVGETSYLLVSIDGIPLNELDTDGIDWNRISLADVERVELLRGPVSAQYGNIGMTGVVNIVMAKPPEGLRARAAIGAGSYGIREASAGLSHGGLKANVSLAAEHRELDGWRENSGFDQTSLTARLEPKRREWSSGQALEMRFSAAFQDAKRDDPGAVLVGQDPRRSFTPADRSDARRVWVDGGLEWALGNDRTIAIEARWQDKSQEVVRTVFAQTPLQQAPLHQVDTQSTGLALRYRQPWGRARLLLGTDAERGKLESRYDLREPLAVRDAARSTRNSVGAFGWVDLPMSARWSVAAALRYDRIDGDQSRATAEPSSTRKTATSPSVAVNWRGPVAGNAWLSWSKSFKAPTLEQLFDQRPYVFFDPELGYFPIVLSNRALEPLRASNLEFGIRVPFRQKTTIDAVLYRSEVRNEIGFDFEAFKFANIAASVHRGVEFNLAAALSPQLSARLAATWTQARFDGGSHDRNQINGVPEQIITVGLTWQRAQRWTFGVEAAHVREQFVDEANRVPLDAYTVLHLRAAYRWRRWGVEVLARNLLDQEFIATGFLAPDERGVNVPNLYPGSPRMLQARIRVDL